MRITKLLRQIVPSVIAHRFNGRPPQGRLVRGGGDDLVNIDLAKALTPQKASSILTAADQGDIGTVVNLWQQMEDADSHLSGVLNTRRAALTKLDWQIVSAAEQDSAVDKAIASKAAEFCRRTLEALTAFPALLDHMASAIGPGISVSELIWKGNKLDSIKAIHPERLEQELDKSKTIRVLIGDYMTSSVPARIGKFVVHMPHSKSGLPQRGALMRSLTLAAIAKAVCFRDWMTYVEIFGMPVRVAKFEPKATNSERREMMKMLETMGTKASAVFPKDWDIELKGIDPRGNAPYESFIRWIEQKQSITVLGQTHTTDTSGQTGTLATAKVHELVRQDILASDVETEAITIRNHLLAPLLRWGFEVSGAPVPYFVREIPATVDREREGRVVDFAQRAGLSLLKSEVYERLQFTEPPDQTPEDQLLEPPMPSVTAGFGSGDLADLFGEDGA